MNPKWKKPRVVKKKVVRKPSTALVTTIKKVISREAETKYVAYNYSPSLWYMNISNIVDDWIPVLPDVPMAGSAAFTESNNNTRIGTSIKPTSCKLHVYANPFATTSVDVYCTLYVFKALGLTNYANNTTVEVPGPNISAGEFLDNGDGNNVAFAGQPWNKYMPVQKDNFTLLHKRTFRLTKGPGQTNAGMTEVPQANSSHFEGVFDIPLPATLKYDETQASANNCAIYWTMGYSHVDGTNPDRNRVVIAGSYTKLYYKDF